MGGFFGWFIVFVGVVAVFNAEKLPALKQMMEEKMKGSVQAAKEGAKMANDKIKKVKTEIENKKNAPAAVEEAEENTPEEIAESLQFMNSYIKDDKEEKKSVIEENKKTEAEISIEEAMLAAVQETPAEPTENQPVDLESRYK